MLTSNYRIKQLLLQILMATREKWAYGEIESIKFSELNNRLIKSLKDTFEIKDEINWENYEECLKDEVIKANFRETKLNLNNDLNKLAESKIIQIDDEKISVIFPFEKLVDLLKMEEMPLEYMKTELENICYEVSDELIDLLEELGLISINVDTVSSLLVYYKDLILDEVLTFIEKHDALQIRYGIYETIMSGSDLITELKLPNDPLYIKIEYALRNLIQEKLILPLKITIDIREWLFRSRIAEIVRLLYKLRQRFPSHRTYHDSPRLVRGVKLEVVDRMIPRRQIHISEPINEVGDQLRAGASRVLYIDFWEQASSILIEVLQNRGFENISDFQERCFKKIFAHLIDPNSSSKGLVIVAPTGTGKTLSFLGPLLLWTILEKAFKGNRGVKAICVYPRIKLAENQIENFIKSLYEINLKIGESKITIGIDYRGTPYSREIFANLPPEGEKTLFEKGLDRLWEFDDKKDSYACPYAKCPRCGEKLYIQRGSDLSKRIPLKCLNPSCSTSIDFVLYCKNDIAENPPDIFITTTESLNLRLYQGRFQKLFGTEDYHPPKLIMIDEIHLHTSLPGSQVAHLIRRLLQRISYGLQYHGGFGEPIVIGLSATVGHADEFFSDLTGIPLYRVEVEGPVEDELVKSGVEYFIFVKPEISENISVLSTLIQTCMCVIHNMSQPEDYPKRNHKALGFVDSLDLVRRWQHDLDDAEINKELFRLRDPEYIMKNKALKEYFGSFINCRGCEQYPDSNCIIFREGECWWLMRYGKSQIYPLEVSYKTAGDGSVPYRYDLLVTTSAMEVGYDDPEMMCVIQYQSPKNLASFTQRKGRGGRKIYDRTISVAVLSPYRANDVYYYRNHHILIEPSFERLPLNVENKSIKRIHGLYAIFDLLAFEHRNINQDFPGYLDIDDVQELERILRNPTKYIEYMKKVFNYKIDEKDIGEVLVLLKKLIDKLNSGDFKRAEPSDIIPEELPRTLFSSINLPTVSIYEYNVFDEVTNQVWNKNWNCSQAPKYPQGFIGILKNHTIGRECPNRLSCSWKHNCKPSLLEPDVDVNLALSEAMIANVTFRWGRTAYWIPPYDTIRELPSILKQMDIKNNWLSFSNQKQAFSVRDKLIPKTLYHLVPRIETNTQSELIVVRPEVIREAIFLQPESYQSHWIYCFDCDKIYAGSKKFQEEHGNFEHQFDVIKKDTKSYPFTFYNIEFRRDLLTEGFFKTSNFSSMFELGKVFSIYSELFPEIYFANRDTGEHLKVGRIFVGSTCDIRTRRGLRVERSFGFLDGELDAALGYQMVTDGCEFVLKDVVKPDLIKKKDPELFSTLKMNFFKFEVLKENKKPGGLNSFSVNSFLDVYLTFISQNNITFSSLQDYLRKNCEDQLLQKSFSYIVNTFFMLNSRTKKEIVELFKRSDFMKIVVEKHDAILEERKWDLISRYIKDTFLHSIKHALKSVFLVLGGFESEWNIGSWANLNFDYDFPEKRIYIFEHGMFGTGAFRSIYQKFKEKPHKIWNLIEENLITCPTAEEEEFLLEVLKLDEGELNEIASLIQEILSTSKFSKRYVEIKKLIKLFRERYSLELTEENIRALIRIFGTSLELVNTKIENWKLYRELNVILQNHLRVKFGRNPTMEEIQEACFIRVTNNDIEPIMPNWNNLFNILKREVDNEYVLFIKKIQEILERETNIKDFLEKLTILDIKEIYELSDDERVKRIVEVMGYDMKDKEDLKKVDKIIELLFEEICEKPSYQFYYNINSRLQISEEDESQLKDLLTKRRIREEVEKRLLNSCIDACPSCLQRHCDIDFELRSRLLLSRRLLKSFILELKEKNTIDADPFQKFEDFKNAVLKELINKYIICIKYSLEKSEMVASLVSDLIATPIEINTHRYYTRVNSSRCHIISLKDHKVIYEVELICNEVSQ